MKPSDREPCPTNVDVSLPSRSDDDALVARARAGDEGAFAELVERYNALVFAAVRAVTGDAVERDDVVQDAWVRAWKGLGSFRGESSVSTWLYRVARNTALNAMRRRRAEMVPLDAVAERADDATLPDERAAHRVDARRLADALARIDERYREVIELHYTAGMTYDDIARVTGRPPGTVRTWIRRGRMALREILEAKP